MQQLRDLRGFLFKSKQISRFPLKFRKSVTSEASTHSDDNFSNLIDERTLQLCENAYLKEPLTRKGILKRSHDTLERWVRIESDNDQIIEIFNELDSRIELKSKLMDLLKNSMIYGSGYLEIVFEGDTAGPNEEPNGTTISKLELIDSKTIIPVYQDNPNLEGYGELLYYLQKIANPDIDDIKLHPKRIIYFAYDTIGDGRTAVGVIEPMLHVVNAKIILDKAAGKIPKKVISQIVTAKIEDVSEDELDAWDTALGEMQEVGRFVTSEKVEIDLLNGGQPLNIKPYSEHLTYQIAGGVGVPFTVLLGAGAGTLSTSETNLRDYYSDLRDLQVRFTPIIKRLLDIELELNNISGEYNIIWNEIYTDEKSEAEIFERKARAIDTLLTAGVISVNEAREILGLDPLDDVEGKMSYGTPVKGGRYAY